MNTPSASPTLPAVTSDTIRPFLVIGGDVAGGGKLDARRDIAWCKMRILTAEGSWDAVEKATDLKDGVHIVSAFDAKDLRRIADLLDKTPLNPNWCWPLQFSDVRGADADPLPDSVASHPLTS